VLGGQMMTISDESQLTVNANNLLKVTSPPAVAGYDGWVPCVGASGFTEVFQPGQPATPVAFGTDWTEPTGGATVSGARAMPSFDYTQLVLNYSATSGVLVAAFDLFAGVA
jgi:hypothetical protein